MLKAQTLLTLTLIIHQGLTGLEPLAEWEAFSKLPGSKYTHYKLREPKEGDQEDMLFIG